MKDKLYKNNKGESYYLIKKIFICACILLASSVVFAIPLSISLMNHNDIGIKQSKQEAEVSSEDNEDTNVSISENELFTYAD